MMVDGNAPADVAPLGVLLSSAWVEGKVMRRASYAAVLLLLMMLIPPQSRGGFPYFFPSLASAVES